jgi:predicted alpha/beta superfamily hydrolase
VESTRRHPVLYLHDGQNVLSSADPGVAFGWGPWNVDTTVERLAAEGRMREVILVAVDNSPKRYQEYRGPAAKLSEAQRAQLARQPAEPDSDAAYVAYKRFLIEELKPAIDARFRTQPEPADTAVLGSSLGGLCSLVLAWEHPEVFGAAASLSGAFQVECRGFLERVLGGYTGPPKPVRIYLDSGVTSGRGDDGFKDTRAVAARLRELGWQDGRNLLHYMDDRPLKPEELRPFNLPPDKFEEAQKVQHNELYWRLRVWRALEFLFPNKSDR